MQPSRIDSLERPSGAGRAPVLVYVAVLMVAAVTLLVGFVTPVGWLVALLVPVVVFATWLAFRVVVQMARPKG